MAGHAIGPTARRYTAGQSYPADTRTEVGALDLARAPRWSWPGRRRTVRKRARLDPGDRAASLLPRCRAVGTDPAEAVSSPTYGGSPRRTSAGTSPTARPGELR